MNIKVFLIFGFLFFGQMNVYADDGIPRNGNTAADSTSLGPTKGLTAVDDHSYILASGSHVVFCGSTDSAYKKDDPINQCQISVTGDNARGLPSHCPSGHVAKVIITPLSNDSSGLTTCPLRGYEIIQPTLVDNIWHGYDLSFTKAYANIVNCGDRSVTISWTIFCEGLIAQ